MQNSEGLAGTALSVPSGENALLVSAGKQKRRKVKDRRGSVMITECARLHKQTQRFPGVAMLPDGFLKYLKQQADESSY